ncbi:DEAD/DEAH box helicase [Clavibacter michiganensis subsp. phaseoli]|uniref:DEAD/DEAH box helicase n=1 Tax=Clavibacter phaseoli TaxID=1734031 RepID=A0A8I0VB75_9MICO|nr:DEAD/DEAH box helicase [Clavibacter phaseoli]MBF4631141.1 DEAD/DEAH box helicase [Clavibacter phaseoli]
MSALSTSEALAYEFHKPAVSSSDDLFVFHEDQARVFFKLMDGHNVVLSAPTSFGKSAILDALIAAGRWSNIVVIVPTVALIDEIRRRLVYIASQYTLITHPTQARNGRNIMVLTQERFLELPLSLEVDFFMIDEFYKLGSSDRSDQRMSMLNIAWNRLKNTGAQYYLTGPNVDKLSDGLSGDLRNSLYVSKYRTVAVDIEDRSRVADDERLSDMSSYWGQLDGGVLVFVAAPARAERLAQAITEFDGVGAPSALTMAVAAWMASSFHPEWRVVTALRRGVAVHTGPMPRSIQRIMIRLFATQDVSTLVCTSTLIEGVNTAARNVVIYDKKINRKPIDYFTYSNVRGRAGRMSRHYVGKVITYMTPPPETLLEVDFPIESQTKEAPLSAIVQLPDGNLNDLSRERLKAVSAQTFLSVATIQANRGIDPELQVAAAKRLKSLRARWPEFTWNRYPTTAQARTVIQFGFEELLTSQQRQGMNFERLWGMLNAVRHSNGNLKDLAGSQYAYKYPQEDLSDVVTRVLSFQRNWLGFTLPSLLSAVERIFHYVSQRQVSYKHYMLQIENLFLESSVLTLDEYGLPLPLAMKLADLGLVSDADMDVVLASLVQLGRKKSIRSKLSSVELWILDDVLDGLGVRNR